MNEMTTTQPRGMRPTNFIDLSASALYTETTIIARRPYVYIHMLYMLDERAYRDDAARVASAA